MRALPDIIRVDEVDSTQRVARALVDDGRAPHGTCVVARRQTGGRGRLGRAWVDVDEALPLSLVLHVNAPHAHASRVTLGAAAALVDAFDALGVDVNNGGARVKWPNDIVIAKPAALTSAGAPDGKLGPFRKVAGILVEVARSSPTMIESVIVGVGINVRNARWPDELASIAASLADAGFAGGVDDVLAVAHPALVDGIERALADIAPTLATLRQRSATLGRRVDVEDVAGGCIARDLDVDGALIVVDDSGREHVVRAGDVWLLPAATS